MELGHIELKFPERLSRYVQFLRLAPRMQDKFRILMLSLLRIGPRIFGATSHIHSQYLRWASKHLKGTVVCVNGIEYEISDFNSLVILSPDFEPFMGCWFTPRTGQVVLDIGAHVGKYALQASKAVGVRGRVIAIEPNPATFEILVRNISLNRAENIVAVNVGASNVTCELKLYRAHQSGWHSFKKDYGLGYDTVKTRRITEILEELGFDHADWIKIDVEGSEREVLEGMQEISSDCPHVIAEVSSPNVNWLKDFAKRYDYDLVMISPLLKDDHVYFYLTHT